jgi:hypothetical protein
MIPATSIDAKIDLVFMSSPWKSTFAQCPDPSAASSLLKKDYPLFWGTIT